MSRTRTNSGDDFQRRIAKPVSLWFVGFKFFVNDSVLVQAFIRSIGGMETQQ